MKDYIKETINTYNAYAERYTKNRKKLIMGKFHEMFIKELKGKDILDLGCGPGRDTRVFLDLGYNVTGFDLSRELLRIAKEKNPEATFVEGDMLDLPFSDASFDGIWSSAVIHHLVDADKERALVEMYRVLKPGGVAFISTKAGEGDVSLPEKEFDGGERFFSYINKEQFEKMLEYAGFRISSFMNLTTGELFPGTDYHSPDVQFHDVIVIK